MDETKEEQSTENTGKGDNPKGLELIERADSAAKRLEEANSKTEELLKRQEELMARDVLGGKGQTAPTEKVEEVSNVEFAHKALNGQI